MDQSRACAEGARGVLPTCFMTRTASRETSTWTRAGQPQMPWELLSCSAPVLGLRNTQLSPITPRTPIPDIFPCDCTVTRKCASAEQSLERICPAVRSHKLPSLPWKLQEQSRKKSVLKI